MQDIAEIKSALVKEYWSEKSKIYSKSNILPETGWNIGSSEDVLDISINNSIMQKINRICGESELGRLILFFSALAVQLRFQSGNKTVFIGTAFLNSGNETGFPPYIHCVAEDGMSWKTLIENVRTEVSLMLNHEPSDRNEVNKQAVNTAVEINREFCFLDEAIQNEPELSERKLIVKLINWQGQYYMRGIFRTGVYSEESVRRLLANILFRLQCMVDNPLSSIDSDIQSSPEEVFYLTDIMNQTVAETAHFQLLHEMFESQVPEFGNKTAIVEGEKRITYQELNENADRIAKYLLGCGIKHNEVIGIIINPQIQVIEAVIAVLKAGCAYCPIDPEMPTDRLKHLLDDADIKIVFTSEDNTSLDIGKRLIINISKAKVLSVDDNELNIRARTKDLAYVIYTSGSSGWPKGVMIEHASIVNQICGLIHRYGFSDGLRHVLMAPLSFDPSVQQIFLPLSTGGTLYLIPDGLKTEPSGFWEFICREKITVINTVPSIMNILLDKEVKLPHILEYVILAGETFYGSLLKRLYKSLTIRHLWNIYGPTEATINTTIYECQKSDSYYSVPIGKPLDNYRVYVLDEKQKLVPFGAIGELYIAGIGLARGYVGNLSETEKKFLENPFENTGSCYYRTGDLVRWLPDGNLEFIGRVDKQVKINGVRIELNEIEMAIKENPLIRDTVVLERGKKNEKSLIAFYSAKEEMDENILKNALKDRLPSYMLPSAFVPVDEMPVTVNGKIDEKALFDIEEQHFKKGSMLNSSLQRENSTLQKLLEIWIKILHNDAFGLHDSFFDAGGNSLSIIRLRNLINQTFQTQISVQQLFAHHTLEQMSRLIDGEEGEGSSKNKMVEIRTGEDRNISEHKDSDIAVIGMACEYPMAEDYEVFWANLCNGVDAVRELPNMRRYNAGIRTDREVKAAYLERIDEFDPEYFHISPGEAKAMDPQQRIFLRVVTQAFQDAGYSKEQIYGTNTGIYIGAGESEYADIVQQTDPMAISGNLSALVAGRISYVYNLTGPSMVIDTACSSSLLAVHQATQGLLAGDCDMAIAGGINLYLKMADESIFEAGIASPRGKARTFDESADGTGGGEGAGAVLLKPLRQAILDGDHIYAVIKGSAANSDGHSNGITAPSSKAQTDLIIKAWKQAGIAPESVSYIETHGTGTKLGDPIEIEGITNAFRQFTKRKQFCAVGSVKSNVGHLDTAAGITGFIKTILVISRKVIPPSLHFLEPNSHIDFIDSPVYVNTELSKWSSNGGKMRAGVSSFGLSGTNCHIVLEEFEEIYSSSEQDSSHLLILSACTEETLLQYILRYMSCLEHTEHSLKDICYCTNISRSNDIYRVALRVSSIRELYLGLEDISLNFSHIREERRWERKGIFFNLERDSEKTVKYRVRKKETIESILAVFLKGVELDWSDFYKDSACRRVPLPSYPFRKIRCWLDKENYENNKEGKNDSNASENVVGLANQIYRSAGRLVYECRYLEKDDVKKSIEQFAAEHIINLFCTLGLPIDAGVDNFSSTTLRNYNILPKYTRLLNYMQNLLKKNRSSIIECNDRNLERLLNSCCYRFPDSAGTFRLLEYCFKHYPDVLTGKKSPLSVLFPDGTSEFLSSFRGKGKTLGDISEQLGLETIKQWILHKSRIGKKIKILEVGAGSGTVGEAVFPELQEICPEYYYTDISQSILYEAEKKFSSYSFVRYKVLNLEKDPQSQGFPENGFDIIIGLNVLHATSSLKRSVSYLKKLLNDDGTLFILEKVKSEPPENLIWGMTDGWWLFEDCDIRSQTPLICAQEWVKLLEEEHFSTVQSYPDCEPFSMDAETALIIGQMGGRNQSRTSELLYQVDWVKKELNRQHKADGEGTLLIFRDSLGIGNELAYNLKEDGWDIIYVDEGQEYNKSNNYGYTINPLEPEDYKKLLAEVWNYKEPSGIIHLWSCTGKSEPVTVRNVDFRLTGLYSLFYLFRTIISHGLEKIIDIRVVTNYAISLENRLGLMPEKAAVFGLTKVIPQEFPKIQAYSIDIDTERYSLKEAGKILAEEIRYNRKDVLILRHANRFVQQLSRYRTKEAANRSEIICRDNVYIITGGAGGLGLETCRRLAEMERVKIVVINRSPLPEKTRWKEWLDAPFGNYDHKRTVKILEAFTAIEKTGSSIYYYSGDVGDADQMQSILEDIHEKIGQVNGIFHCAAASGETSNLMEVQSFDNFRKVLYPKIHGTIVLNSVITDELDFIVYYSSVASLWGGVSGGDYAAANAFLDFFSFFNNAEGRRTLSVNWYAWKNLTGPGCMGYMSADEALDALFTSIKYPINQIAIGRFDSAILKEWEPMMKIQLGTDVYEETVVYENEKKAYSEIKNKKIQPVLKGRKDSAYSAVEQQIGEIWAEILGFEEVDVNVNFFDIGGDSLMVIKVLKSLNEAFHENLEAGDMFSYSTVAQMAEYIEGRSKNPDSNMELQQEIGSNESAEERYLRQMLKDVKTEKVTVNEALKGYIDYGE